MESRGDWLGLWRARETGTGETAFIEVHITSARSQYNSIIVGKCPQKAVSKFIHRRRGKLKMVAEYVPCRSYHDAMLVVKLTFPPLVFCCCLVGGGEAGLVVVLSSTVTVG